MEFEKCANIDDFFKIESHFVWYISTKLVNKLMTYTCASVLAPVTKIKSPLSRENKVTSGLYIGFITAILLFVNEVVLAYISDVWLCFKFLRFVQTLKDSDFRLWYLYLVSKYWLINIISRTILQHNLTITQAQI